MTNHLTNSEASKSKISSRTGFSWLIMAALVTVILWRIPSGNYILYPFTILATWFHEMAHGLAAMMLGGNFQKLIIYPNGSGLAYYTGPLFLGSVGQAVVAAAGPLGPPIAGATLIITSRNTKNTDIGLYVLGIVLIVSTVLWVRSLFGLVAIPALGIAILAIAMKASPHVQGFAGQFLGVQACVSTYHQIDYLFRYSAGPLGISDTGQIQHVLILPYWFWGALLAVASFLILILSLRIAYRS